MLHNAINDAERLRRLQLVTDAALAHLQLDELLASLLVRTRDVLGIDTAAILLLDEEQQELVARAAIGLEEEVEQGVRIPVGRGFAGRIAAQRRPIVLDDVDHADVLNPILRQKGVKSLLGVPLVVESTTLGVLHIGSLVPRRFSPEEIELLQLVGDRAALAIEHARAYEAERRARERLEHLQSVTDAALAHLDVDELLGELLHRIRSILAADTCAVLLLDPERDELVARAAVGLEEEVEQGVRIPLGRGFAGRVAAQRRPIVLDDVDHADIYNPILRQKGVKSMLGVPLVANGVVLGVLHVGTLVPRRFTRDDVDLLQLVADRMSLGLEHARLYAAERHARQRLEHLQAVTDTALAHLELDELFGKLLHRIRSILAADTCAVLLLDPERDELVARAAVGLEEEVERGVRIPLGRGFAGRVAAQRRPIILDDVDHADIVNPILREKGVKSMLGVPLLVRDAAIGVLHVGSLTPRLFTSDDTQLLQLVAERVALAIEKARLHEEITLLNQLKLNFVAIASHELRTPATAVSGALLTLTARGDTLPADTRSELLTVANEQAIRLTRLIEQLLDLSRLDEEALKIAPQPLVLARVVGEIAAETLPPDAAVTIDVPDDLAVVADRLVLDRVLSNLLVNATRHGRPPIVVRATQGDAHLRIAVADAGAGVPPELRGRLFERFQRGEHGRGSGLGLAIARAYARAHGGDLLYEAADAGARFVLVLPTRV